MANSNGKSTFYRWEIKEFGDEWRKNQGDDIYSDKFYFGASRFSLYYHSYDLWEYDTFGITMDELIGKRPLEVNLKLWFENSEGQKFQESIQKFTFKNESASEGSWEFNLKQSDADYNPLSNVFAKNETLYICCEITDYQTTAPKPTVSKPVVSKTDLTQQFHQNAWLAYEQEKHDAVIKLGQTEFKILKTFFTVQSEVFDRMFSSAFKESKTSTVEISDVPEHTMKQIVKWMYTCQIDSQDSIEDLFEAADKYQVHLLKTNCSELMIKSLDNSSAFRRLILAVTHNNQDLKDAALKNIEKMPMNEATIYFLSPEWSEFVQAKPVVAEEVKIAIVKKLKK